LWDASNISLTKDDVHQRKEKRMKKAVFILALALVFGLTIYAVTAEAQMGPGMMGGGGYGMGPGMMGGGG
jgi:hypothetical protein